MYVAPCYAFPNLPTYGRIVTAIGNLASTPRPGGVKKLVGSDSWRIRIGDYRVLYDIDDEAQVVTVLDVGHRSDIYR